MKLRTSLIAAVAFITGVTGAVVLPAFAQQAEPEPVWEVIVSRPTVSNTVNFLKYNRVTGQALVLTCHQSDCGKGKMKWLELAVEVVD